MAKPELGNKHQCQQCGTKFFDLNKTPVVCPKCGALLQVTARMARPGVADEEEIETEAGPELVSLDEAEPAEETLDVGVDEDVEIEDEADDTFLEEEEEDNDDVSGLIDGDLAGDEER